MEENEQMRMSSDSEFVSELDKRRKQREKETKQKEFDEKIEQLADKAIQFSKERGKNDSLTVLLINFLDVALEMKNLMKTMSAINVAMECLSDAIGFLDCAIDFDNALMDESLMHKYGFFQRLKQKRKMRKTIRNNYGRMVSISNGLAMKYKMAKDMMNSLSKVGEKLKKVVNKTAKKEAEKAKKTGTTLTPSTAEKFIAERMKNQESEDSGNNGEDIPSSRNNGGANSSPKNNGGIDDIL